jgi:hypothetical protein
MIYNKNMDFLVNILQNNKKHITFNGLVNVILIPSNKEIQSFKNELWWNKVDYMIFYCSAQQEIVDFLEQNSNINRKEAMKLLYQPNESIEKGEKISNIIQPLHYSQI